MRFIAVALGAFALMLAVGASALADSNYADAPGDQPNGLDITTMSVGNDTNSDTITVTVNLANAPTLTTGQEIDVLIDSDQNGATGDPNFGGVDYDVALASDGYEYLKWDPTQGKWVDDDASLLITYQPGVMTLTFSPPDVGVTSLKAFNFGVLTASPNPNDASHAYFDAAPDSGPLFNYTLTAAPATPPVPVAKPTVVSTSLAVSGSGKAGTTLVVKALPVDLSNGTRVKAKNLKCTAKLGGASFKGTGAGGCTFKLPKTAKGKNLVLHATGAYGPVKVGATEIVRVH